MRRSVGRSVGYIWQFAGSLARTDIARRQPGDARRGDRCWRHCAAGVGRTATGHLVSLGHVCSFPIHSMTVT